MESAVANVVRNHSIFAPLFEARTGLNAGCFIEVRRGFCGVKKKRPPVEASGFGGVMDSFRHNGQFSEIPRVKIPKIWVLPKSGFTFPKSNFTIPEARSCARGREGFLPRKSGGSGYPRFRAGARWRSRLAAGGRCKNEQLFIFFVDGAFSARSNSARFSTYGIL